MPRSSFFYFVFDPSHILSHEASRDTHLKYEIWALTQIYPSNLIKLKLYLKFYYTSNIHKIASFS